MSEKSPIALDIARLLATDDAYSAKPWVALVMVGEAAQGRTAMNGFAYLDDGKSVPVSPRNMEVLKKLKDLATAMEQESGKRWLACIIRLNRKSEKVDIHFEYDDASKWLITPKNVGAMAERLRPAA